MLRISLRMKKIIAILTSFENPFILIQIPVQPSQAMNARLKASESVQAD